MGRATAAAAVVTLVACLGSSTITSTSAFVVTPFSARSILPSSSSSMRPAASARSACLSRSANKLVGALQAGSNDNNNNGGNKDDLYYQRFMGMNEGEPTDDVRVAAEIADMDPSTIDSLRRGTSMDDKVKMSPSSSSSSPPSNPFYIGGDSGSSSGGISSGGGGGRGIGSSASGFLDSMKKKSAASFSTLGGSVGGGMGGGMGGGGGGGGGMNANLQKGSPDMMMMTGPKVYIIPQNQGEAPLEVKSLAPGQRRSKRGVIAEIPGRSLPKRPGRVDLSQKMAEVKRTIQEAPTRLTELQVQNLRNGAAIDNPNPNTNNNNPNAQNNNKNNNNGQQQQNQFTFPSFPAQQPVQQQQKPQSPSSPSGRSRSKRRGTSGREEQGGGSRRMNSRKASPASEFKFPKLPAWSKDWRVWVGGIAAVSFFMALVNSLSYRSELMVMDSRGGIEGGRDGFMLERRVGQQQQQSSVGEAVERLFV